MGHVDVMISEDQVRETLKKVNYPGFSRDIVSFGMVKRIALDGNKVTVFAQLTTSDQRVPATLDKEIRQALAALEGIGEIAVEMQVKEPVQAAASPQSQGVPGVKHIVAVASGKGGVGKSTVSSNLAVAAAKQGLKVGLLDCDLYGPSIGLMFDAVEKPEVTDEEKLVPIDKHGVKLMSMGFLVGEDSPVILRGPMVTRYTQQFLGQTEWGELDLLILDLPPGTGDIQLTIVQTVPLSGAVIVTTPQEVALLDARKAVRMFEKVNVPILGFIENMSYFVCPEDQNRYYIFGEGGGRKEATRFDSALLAEVPLEIETREAGDKGMPITLKDSGSIAAQAFNEAASNLILELKI